MRLLELYEIANDDDITIDYFPMKEVCSFSMPGTIVMDVDKFDTTLDEKVHLAHELGHCMTGSFYNVYSPCDLKSRHEHRADRWSIQRLLPLEDLKEAIKCGITETWELAEYFESPEWFLVKAVKFYRDCLNFTGL